MNRSQIITILALIPAIALAGWLKTYASAGPVYYYLGSCVQQAPEGGYVVAADNGRRGADADLTLMKVDNNGNTVWVRIYGKMLHGLGLTIKNTPDGGYIIAGDKYLGQIGIGGDSVALWMFKTDAEGEIEWSKTYDSGVPGYAPDADNCDFVDLTTDGGYIFLGTRNLGLDCTGAFWLLRTDAQGDTLWTKTFKDTSPQTTWQSARCVKQTSDGGYILTGRKFWSMSWGAWVIKTDSLGEVEWDTLFGARQDDPSTEDINETTYESAYSISETSDGGYVLAGYSSSANEVHPNELIMMDFWLLRLDQNGNKLWEQLYGDDTLLDEAGWVEETDDGGFILTGIKDNTGLFGTSKCWLLKTDESGEVEWSREFGGDGEDCTYCVSQTTDGGYILSGRMDTDLLLIKTDEYGNLTASESPIVPQPAFEVPVAIGPLIILSSPNRTTSTTLVFYDATGTKVDEVRIDGSSQGITWGMGHAPGVYFIRDIEGNTATRKVVLVK